MRKLFKMENEVEIKVTHEGILNTNPGYVLVRKDEYKKKDL